MKLKTLAAALAICLLCCSAFSMTAFAAENQTSASTSVLYTVQGGYTVNIPASVDLNAEETIEITASELRLPENKNLVVRVSDESLNDSHHFVMSADGVDAKLTCEVYRKDYNDPYNGTTSRIRKSTYGTDASLAALFTNLSTKSDGTYYPTKGGSVYFTFSNSAPVAGNFSGTLNFVIGLEDPQS